MTSRWFFIPQLYFLRFGYPYNVCRTLQILKFLIKKLCPWSCYNLSLKSKTFALTWAMLVSIMFNEFLGNLKNRHKLHQGHNCVFFLSSGSSETLNFLVNLGFHYNLLPFRRSLNFACLFVSVLLLWQTKLDIVLFTFVAYNLFAQFYSDC